MKLYYFAPSPPCRAVNLAIHALGLHVDYVKIDLMRQDNLKPDFLKVNPQHTVPTIIDDDGFILWNSPAINQYLVSKYGREDDPLYPKDLHKRAIVDQRLHYYNDIFNIVSNILKYFFIGNKSKLTDEDRKAAKEGVFDVVEMYLHGRQWIAGDTITIADFHYISILMSLTKFVSPGDDYPNMTAYMERCAKNMKDYEIANSYNEQDITLP